MSETKMTQKQIIIKFTPGSKFQEKSAWKAIKTIVYSWKIFYKNSHKKNKIEIIEK